jgi:long-chain acyl-CoA synthetase
MKLTPMINPGKTFPTIIEKFYEFEKKQPDRLFLSEPVKGKDHPFTWKEAGIQIRKMTAFLQSLQLPAQSKIAILGKNSAHWIMADLAIMMAGHISVPQYPNLTAATLETILTHSECKVIFIGKLDYYEELKPGIADSILKITFPFYPKEDCLNWDELIRDIAPLETNPLPDPELLNCILYTSGTTGDPKGVMHTHYAHSFSLLTVLEALGNDFDREIFFSYLPLCHVAERMVVEYTGIYCGGTVYFPESLEKFSENLVAVQPTVFLAVPRIWEKFQEEILKKISPRKLNIILSVPLLSSLFKKMLKKKLGLSRAKYVLTGASPIKKSLLEWFARLGIIIQEAYGMTENMALTSINRKDTARFGTVGQSYPGVEMKLGKDNEVLVKSPASMVGYYKEPELTAQSFEDGFLKTGDEGEIDKDGYLTITGRIKDQFKTSKGKYIAPAPIEKLLLESPYISQVCVVGSGMAHILALCVLPENISLLEKENIRKELKDFVQQVNEKQEFHERVAKLVFVAEEWTVANGFFTPTMKIRRKIIDNYYSEQYVGWLNAAEEIIVV